MKARTFSTSSWRPSVWAPLALCLATTLVAYPADALTINVVSTDGAGEGFNDPTPVAPVAGNPGTTLGAQRLYLFQYAADTWGVHLKGNVPVVVSASFEDLGGDAFSAILGQASPASVHRDFPGAPLPGTWYVASLANERRGADLNNLSPESCFTGLVDSNCPEIVAQFNSSVDNAEVLGDLEFYYGLDGNSGDNIDFLSVLLHEIGHGLGFLDLIDPSTGQKYFDYDDAFINNLEDPNVNPRIVPQMSDTQRTRAIVDDSMLVWIGPAVKAASGFLSSGVRDDGAVQMYAPAGFRSGSSVAHFDTDLFPNELMEPFSTNPPPHDLTLTLAALKDMGWSTTTPPACGDANGDGAINSPDALALLRGAIGSTKCPAYVCDVNYAGGVSAVDAQTVLKYSVGLNIALNCPRG